MLLSIALATSVFFGPALDGNGNVRRVSSIVYRQDARTGLCFSFFTQGNATSHSIVPCTAEVLKLVEEDRKRELGE